MLGVKEETLHKTAAAGDVFDPAVPTAENGETERNARPEMIVVMGVVALGAMALGFLLGLLF